MQQETSTLDGILDIVLPLAPIDNGWTLYSILALIILLSGIVVGIGYRWWKRPRQHCRRELRNLLRRHEDGDINAQQTVFMLAEILRERIHRHQLPGKAGLPMHLQQHQTRWQAFIRELDTARYSSSDIDEAMLGRLANETSFWLGRW